LLSIALPAVAALLTGSPPPRWPRHAASCQPNGLLCRRAVLLGGLSVGLGRARRVSAADGSIESMVLQYDSTGKLVSSYEDETAFRDIRSGSASVRILANWREGNDGSLTDPVQGSAASALRFSASQTAFKKISDLGRAEQLVVQRDLGLPKDLVRADMVAAARRVQDGTEYYDYDLALPAAKCVAELATACLPSMVTLLSCCVKDGQLHVLQVDANPDEWRRAGKALKNLRSTFSVASPS